MTSAETKEAWERRARACRDDLRSVLFRGLPQVLNEEIHLRHVAAVLEGLSDVPASATVLDVGCGYGRVSAALREARPSWHLVGVDMAKSFVNRYRSYVGGSQTAAVCAQLPRLPFCDQSFDAAVVVTCLMYFETPEWIWALKEILRVMRPTGSVVIIEPGLQGEFIYTGAGILSRLARPRGAGGASPTGGRSFAVSEFARGVRLAGGQLRRMWGMPLLTCLLTPVAGTALLSSRIAKRLCEVSRGIDRIAEGNGRGSVYLIALVTLA